MLDTETQTIKAGQGLVQGQRILVLGACCGFGRSVVRRLVAQGAQVIVADTNLDALGKIGGAVPLPLKSAPHEAVRRIGRKWGEVRLDGVLNLMPLRQPTAIEANLLVLQSIVQGFMPALCSVHGQIVTVVTRPDQDLEITAAAMGPALGAAHQTLAHALRRDGLSLNIVHMSDGNSAPAQTAVVGLLSRAMGPLSGAELRL